MKEKFTKEPWKIANLTKRWNECYKIFSGSRQLAQVSTDGARNDSVQTTANAILMVSAPTMLKLLQKVSQLDREHQSEVEAMDDATPSDYNKWSELQEIEHKFACKEIDLQEEINDFLKKIEPELFYKDQHEADQKDQ